jgi:hypothetical protein
MPVWEDLTRGMLGPRVFEMATSAKEIAFLVLLQDRAPRSVEVATAQDKFLLTPISVVKLKIINRPALLTFVPTQLKQLQPTVRPAIRHVLAHVFVRLCHEP